MFPEATRRHILLLLGAKIATLTLIYFALIAPATRPEPDVHAMAAHLLGGSGN